MTKHIEITDIPPNMSNKVKQNLRFKTGNFIWRVKFNIPLDPKTVNNNTMYVTNSLNQKMRSLINYNMEMGQIEIEAAEAYATSEQYTLHITTQVKSKGGQSLKEPVQIKFKL